MEVINATKSFDHNLTADKDNALALAMFGIYRGFVGLIGTLGNFLVILAVLTTKKLRTPANIFILSLAFADMYITAFMEPVTSYVILLDRGLYSRRPGLCTAIASMCYISCTCSLWNIGAIAINRYVLICKRQYYNSIFTWRKTISYAVLIWIICLFADFCNIFGWGGHSLDSKTLSCTYDRLASYSHVLFTVFVFISLPTALIVVCYAAVFWTLRQSSRRIQDRRSL